MEKRPGNLKHPFIWSSMLWIFLFLQPNLFAIDYKIDSLKKQLALSRNADQKVELMMGLSNMFLSVNPDSSLIAAPTLTSIIKTPPIDKEDLVKKVNELQKTVNDLKWNNLTKPECIDCKYWKDQECQGGCTVYKLLK